MLECFQCRMLKEMEERFEDEQIGFGGGSGWTGRWGGCFCHSKGNFSCDIAAGLLAVFQHMKMME